MKSKQEIHLLQAIDGDTISIGGQPFEIIGVSTYDGYTEFQLRRGDTMEYMFDLEALSFLGATAYHGGNSSNEPFNPVSIATDDVAFEIENKAWELFVHNIDLSNFSDALELAENVVRERDAWRRKRQERKTSE